ncbi:hypothetical protein [Acinetobacter vivianii]
MTQLQNSVRLGIITVISHSCSQEFTLLGVITNGASKEKAKAK